MSPSLFSAVPHVDDCFIALGTTIKIAGSQAAFRAIDFDAVISIAHGAYARGATKLGVVSAMGADLDSSIFYNRVKGEMEAALAKVGFNTLVIARPSMLAGDRDALRQPARAGERIALAISRHLKPFIPVNYRSIAANDVAAALTQSIKCKQDGVYLIPSGEMQDQHTLTA